MRYTCDAWLTQGHAKSAAFLRAVYGGGILPALRARAGAIANDFARVAGRANFPRQVRNAHLEGLRARMHRLEDRWRRRIEAEARECGHIERRERSGVQSQAVDFFRTNGNIPDENSPAWVQPVSSDSASAPAKRRSFPEGKPQSKTQSTASAAAEGNQHSKRLTKPLLLKYRSGIKSAILLALTKNPRATDAEVCRLLDADGGEELPIGWRKRREDRSFFDAYTEPPTKRKIEIVISKIRRDLRDRGLLN